MIIAPNIDGVQGNNGHISSAFADGDRLYLFLNAKLDADLPPLPADLTLVTNQSQVGVLSLKIEHIGNSSILALLLEKPISTDTNYGIKYRPTQWLMCTEGLGDSIEAFDEKIYTKPVDALEPGLRLKVSFDAPGDSVADEETVNARQDANAYVVCATEFRIELGFGHELSTAIPLNPNEFRAELEDRWLKITSVKYVEPRSKSSPEIHLELSEPMATGATVLVAYRSPIGRLKTISEDSIAGFVVEAVVDSGSYGILDAERDSDAIIDDAKTHRTVSPAHPSNQKPVTIALVANDSSNHEPGDNNVKEEAIALEGSSDDISTDSLSPADRALNLEQALENHSVVKGQRAQRVLAKTQESKIIDEVDTAQASNGSGSEDMTNALAEFDNPDQASQISSADDNSSAPGKNKNFLSKLKAKSSFTTSSQEPLSLTAKLIYVVPIAIFCWLLFIICIYIATIAFDIDLSISSLFSGGNKQNTAEVCTLKSSDGSVYEGECKDGIRHGQGIYTWVSGNRYEGAWKEGKRHGKGKLVHASGAVYDGNFSDGLEHGRGIMTWPNGARYEGEYSQGKFHGIGIYTSAQGNLYEGIFENGSMTANGDCTMATGEQYPGPCKSK